MTLFVASYIPADLSRLFWHPAGVDYQNWWHFLLLLIGAYILGIINASLSEYASIHLRNNPRVIAYVFSNEGSLTYSNILRALIQFFKLRKAMKEITVLEAYYTLYEQIAQIKRLGPINILEAQVALLRNLCLPCIIWGAFTIRSWDACLIYFGILILLFFSYLFRSFKIIQYIRDFKPIIEKQSNTFH